eukprot:TRINITY_DN513_c1_g2_i1.p1 TRINITY_DN513_c1_g2~~TRINITY_DN513_c1_g2_i1.p1  ORF type:complete len:213 (+),score=25.79 TRINITY_DN513_c1_g2_i1:114-752(+)
MSTRNFSEWGIHRSFDLHFRGQTDDSVPKVKPDKRGLKSWETLKCVSEVVSEDMFDKIKAEAARSNKFVVFKYVRDNCPACGIVSVAMEKMCKKYSRFGYIDFYEVNEKTVPTVSAKTPKTPHVEGFWGSHDRVTEIDAEPPLMYRRAALENVEGVVQVEEMKGNKLSKEEIQRMMMKSLIDPARKQAEESLMQALVEFNREKATNYFKAPV